jgi:tRNA threonylcarbamoyladenosine biosynthesis protein TsaE
MKVYVSHSINETILLGQQLGSQLKENSIVCLCGDLGAGKTTFIKGLVSGACQYPEEEVNSPTFVYLNVYKGKKTLYHFDLYRLHNAEEFLNMGFDEFFYAGGICCIEWSEKILSLLPQHCLFIKIEQGEEENTRKIIFDETLLKFDDIT